MGYTSLRDIAPTAMHLLGLEAGEYMVGRVVTEALIDGDCKPLSGRPTTTTTTMTDAAMTTISPLPESPESGSGGGGVVQFVFGFVSCAAVVLTSTVALLVTKRILRKGGRWWRRCI